MLVADDRNVVYTEVLIHCYLSVTGVILNFNSTVLSVVQVRSHSS